MKIIDIESGLSFKQYTTSNLKNTTYEDYKSKIEKFAVKNNYNIPSEKSIRFSHDAGLYINMVFYLLEGNKGKTTTIK